MTTDHDIHEPPELAPDAAVDTPRPDPQPDEHHRDCWGVTAAR